MQQKKNAQNLSLSLSLSLSHDMGMFEVFAQQN